MPGAVIVRIKQLYNALLEINLMKSESLGHRSSGYNREKIVRRLIRQQGTVFVIRRPLTE